MSSPIRRAKDLDAALVYAPPWAREPARRVPVKPATLTRQAPRWNLRVSDTEEGFSGDRAMPALQRQLALHPHGVPEPPLEGAPSQWPFVLRLCAVSGIAAVVAWGAVSLTGSKRTLDQAAQASPDPPQAVQAETRPAPIAPKHVRLVHVGPAGADSAAPVQETFTTAAQPAPPADPPAISVASAVSVPQPASPKPESTASALGEDEIATLVKRGKDFLVNGDLASARLLLRRAAEAGSAAAALSLGATYDPFVIAKLGAIGAEPDVERARQWYQKAAQLGSGDASQQLAKLAQLRQ